MNANQPEDRDLPVLYVTNSLLLFSFLIDLFGFLWWCFGIPLSESVIGIYIYTGAGILLRPFFAFYLQRRRDWVPNTAIIVIAILLVVLIGNLTEVVHADWKPQLYTSTPPYASSLLLFYLTGPILIPLIIIDLILIILLTRPSLRRLMYWY